MRILNTIIELKASRVILEKSILVKHRNDNNNRVRTSYVILDQKTVVNNNPKIVRTYHVILETHV